MKYGMLAERAPSMKYGMSAEMTDSSVGTECQPLPPPEEVGMEGSLTDGFDQHGFRYCDPVQRKPKSDVGYLSEDSDIQGSVSDESDVQGCLSDDLEEYGLRDIEHPVHTADVRRSTRPHIISSRWRSQTHVGYDTIPNAYKNAVKPSNKKYNTYNKGPNGLERTQRQKEKREETRQGKLKEKEKKRTNFSGIEPCVQKNAEQDNSLPDTPPEPVAKREFSLIEQGELFGFPSTTPNLEKKIREQKAQLNKVMPGLTDTLIPPQTPPFPGTHHRDPELAHSLMLEGRRFELTELCYVVKKCISCGQVHDDPLLKSEISAAKNKPFSHLEWDTRDLARWCTNTDPKHKCVRLYATENHWNNMHSGSAPPASTACKTCLDDYQCKKNKHPPKLSSYNGFGVPRPLPELLMLTPGEEGLLRIYAPLIHLGN
eukprot:Lithocolla_globosa_v1_NODE_551_length_3760_cov_28.499055.p2 type:complete len:428 gc:universal NODE_551_length_3760_cov_28.499055:2008-725(-)